MKFSTFLRVLCSSAVASASTQLPAKANEANYVATGIASFQQRQGQGTIIEFDAPGAAKVTSKACATVCGTQALANNAQGAVVGFYSDKYVVQHGFLRTPKGEFISFEAPGAGLKHGFNEGTAALGVNDEFMIAGVSQDSGLALHGFVRDADGRFKIFDAPAAGTGPNEGTVASSINNGGETAGYYVDARNVAHGFVRTPGGQLTSFDPSGSVSTFVGSLDAAGVVNGYYLDVNKTYHGFVRRPNGDITEIDAPGAGNGNFLGTILRSISPENVSAGFVRTSNGAVRGFLRYPNGSNAIFDVARGAFTVATSINSRAAVTGQFVLRSSPVQGFWRSPQGAIVTFSAPGAGTLAGQGTVPSAINEAGNVAGYWVDAKYLNHGFVWKP